MPSAIASRHNPGWPAQSGRDTAGVLAGSSADAHQSKEEGRIVGAVARRIAPGAVAVVADVMESGPAVIDAMAGRAGATVTRWSRPAAEAEPADAAVQGREPEAADDRRTAHEQDTAAPGKEA